MKKILILSLMLLSFNAVAAKSWYADERTCLALNIYHEARSEAVQGHLAVGMVTLNRVRSKKFPDTICGVVWQKAQFSWTRDGKSDKPLEVRAWKHSRLIANYLYAKYEVYSAISEGSIDVTDGALFYYAHNIVYPHWADDHTTTTIIGGHTFQKEL